MVKKNNKSNKKTRFNKKISKENETNNFSIERFTNPFNDLNNSKYFTGIMLILVNLGSKYVSLELSKTQEAYLKYTIGRQVLIFSILWVGTRDIIISLVLTAVFIMLASYLLNENSKYCIIPESYRKMELLLDTNGDGVVSEKEIDDALDILKKAKKQKNNQNNEEDLSRENFL
tara:strand:- start:2817 stop:3338 length:522 start_codon:yes stop_codon:yes gene_type:complete